jgi:hypothetical protein
LYRQTPEKRDLFAHQLGGGIESGGSLSMSRAAIADSDASATTDESRTSVASS